jgi:protein SCO1/2
MLAFLYSRCGAPCVLIAQQIRGALDELPPGTPALIVSADPHGDTPASVRRFLGRVSLSGRVHYLTGSEAELGPLWRAYRVKPASAGERTFAEYAPVVLIDARGDERVLFQSEQLTPEALAHDIRRLGG